MKTAKKIKLSLIILGGVLLTLSIVFVIMAINHIEEIQYYSNASNQARDEWLYGNTFGNSQAFNTMADADELKAFAIFFTALFFICAGATGFPGLFFLLAGFGLKAMASKKEEVKTEAKDLKQYI